MNRQRLILLGCVVIVLFGTRGWAQDLNSGNGLLVSCQTSIRQMDNPGMTLSFSEGLYDGYCTGIVTGVTAASPLVCPGKGATVGQEIRVVVKFLQDHPEKLNLRNTDLIEQALSEAFPCSK